MKKRYKIELNEASQTALLSYKKRYRKIIVPEISKENSTIPKYTSIYGISKSKNSIRKTVKQNKKENLCLRIFMTGLAR